MGRVAPLALLLLAAGLLAAGAGAAGRATPIGPTLSLVALSPKDVGGGARTVRQRSLRSPGYIAAFERELEFRGGAVGRSVLFYLTSTVELARLPGTPRAELAGVRKQLATRAGRVEMVKNIEGELRQDLGDSLKAAAMGTVRFPKIGAGAVIVPISVTTTSARLQLVLTYLQVDRMLVTTSLAGSPVAREDVERLLRVTAGKARGQLGPANVSLPTIAGEARAGAQLTASSGSWRNEPTGYAYRWRRCDTTGDACTSLPGATVATYAATAADVGATLRVVVTARNAAGKVDAVSPPTAVVAPA
jgi:predicted secreted protein